MLYTVYDVEKITGISAYTIRKKIRDGILPASKEDRGTGFGSGYRISDEDLRIFVSRDSKYSYILKLLEDVENKKKSQDPEKLALEIRIKELELELLKKESNDDPEKLDLKIRNKELEIKLLKYESKFGPLD